MNPRVSFSSGLLLLLFLAGLSQAAEYTFSGLTGTQNFSDGADWDVTPVGAADTILTYSGILASGATVGSNNDVASPFTLNRINFNYTGPGSGTAPVVTLTGSPLEFTGSSAQITYHPSGSSLASRPRLIIDNDILLSSTLRVHAQVSGAKPEVTLNGVITGGGGLTFTGQAGQPSTFRLTNPGNDYSGNTSFTLNSTSGRDHVLVLGAGNVIPNGVGRGNLYLAATSEQGRLHVNLNGFDQTINGLSSNIPVRASGAANVQRVRNASSTGATLTIGDADTSGTFTGLIEDGAGGGALSVTKTGSGTQILSGASTHTGDTTIEGGTLKVDYSIFGTSKTSAPADYFSSQSNLILGADATFAIEGRTDGAASETTGVAISNSARDFVLPNAVAAQLVVGQELLFTKTGGGGTPVAEAFIVGFDAPGATTTRVWGNKRLSSGASTVTVDTGATTATTSQTLAGLTLSGTSGSNATLDFGSSDSLVLQFNSAPVQLNDGSTLTILNWDGLPGGGGAERLMFLGDSADFSAVFAQNEVIFDGYGAGYSLISGIGEYEVTAIPEPTSLLLFLIAGASLLALRRRR